MIANLAAAAVTLVLTLLLHRYINKGLHKVEPLAARQIAKAFREEWPKVRQNLLAIGWVLPALVAISFFVIIRGNLATGGWSAVGLVIGLVLIQLNRVGGRYGELAVGAIMFVGSAMAKLNGGVNSSWWGWTIVAVGLAVGSILIFRAVVGFRPVVGFRTVVGDERAEQQGGDED